MERTGIEDKMGTSFVGGLSGAGKLIVVMDDDEVLAGAVCDSLAWAGHMVCRVFDGEHGMRVLGEVIPDVVIVDLNMPRMGGLEVCERIRADERFVGVKVIIHSAKNFAADKRAAQRLGAGAYLVKPTVIDDILEAIEGRA